MSQSILSNTIIASTGRIINVALGVVVLSLISRFLGVAQYGSYTLLLAYGAILQIAADFGLYLTLSRNIVRHPNQENYYLSHITSLRLTLLAAIFGLGGFISLVIPSLRGLITIYPLIALGFMAQSLSQLMMSVYQKYGTVWRATSGDIIGRLVQVAGLVLLGAAGATLTSVTVLFALSLAVATCVHRRLLPPSLHIRPAFTWPAWRRLLAVSWPLGAVLMLNVIYFRIDTVLLSLYRPADQVGLYGLAYRLVESCLFLPAMFGGLLLPHLSFAWLNNRANFNLYFQQGAAAVVWAAVFTVLTLAVFAEPVISLVAGPTFTAAAPLLRILSVALGVMFLGNFASFSLVAAGRQKTLLIIAATGAVANIVLNLIFIPPYGAPAAALVTLVTEVIVALSAGLAVLRLARVAISPAYLARLTAVTLITVLVYAFLPAHWPILIIITIGAVTYCAASIITRLITGQNLSLLLTSSHAHL